MSSSATRRPVGAGDATTRLHEDIRQALDIPIGSIGSIRARCLARLARNSTLRSVLDG